MKKSIFIRCLIIFSFIFMLFSVPVHASGLTDIDDLNDMFTFEGDTSDGSLLSPDMQFNAGGEDVSDADFWNKIFKEYHDVIVGVSGVCLLTFSLLFLFNFAKLGSTAGNPQARAVVVKGLLWTGFGAAASGGVVLFVGFFMNLMH